MMVPIQTQVNYYSLAHPSVSYSFHLIMITAVSENLWLSCCGMRLNDVGIELVVYVKLQLVLGSESCFFVVKS